MSTLGAQEAIVTAAPGEWELIGRDMIRTKRTADGGGMVVAQFWTSPAPEHAALMVAAPELLEALKTAKETIRAWHGPNAWDIYDRASPEMKAINSAIAKAEGRS